MVAGSCPWEVSSLITATANFWTFGRANLALRERADGLRSQDGEHSLAICSKARYTFELFVGIPMCWLSVDTPASDSERQPVLVTQ